MIGTRFYGRMGNVCFQAATTIAFAMRNGQEFSFPNRTTDSYWNPLYFQDLVHPNWVQGREDVLINEPHYHYAPLEYRKEWNDKQVVLNGYFQSELYFKDFRTIILDLFNFPYELKPTISIHARYGDYLRLQQKHILMNEDYLKRAMDEMIKRTGIKHFKVFSDDIQYFKNNLGHLYDFDYSTKLTEVDDMVEMSCCHSNINSSSTFAWWGAWMNRNPDKVVITPEKWFQDGWDGLNTKDVIPESWLKL